MTSIITINDSVPYSNIVSPSLLYLAVCPIEAFGKDATAKLNRLSRLCKWRRRNTTPVMRFGGALAMMIAAAEWCAAVLLRFIQNQ